MTYPPTIPVKQIDRKASEYDLYASAWQAFSDLFQGGAVLKDAVLNRGQYLLKKPKELSEVFSTRQLRFSYTNLLGNIIGWYSSALFKTPPQIVKKQGDSEVEKGDAADFCAAWEKDCDRGGCGFVEFTRRVAETALLHKSAYVMIDLPGTTDQMPASLAQQQAAGLLDPFLVLYSPSQVINWQSDRYGNLEWCVIAICDEERSFGAEPKIVDYWYFFNRTECALYSSPRPKNGKRGEADMAELVPGYPRRHALADQGRVPIRKVELPDGLWLANRVYLPLLNHLNLDNAFDFGLFQAALAQLVIVDGPAGTYEEPVTISEVGYHKLPAGGEMYYLEPEGRAFEAIDKRLQTLEERIYKACYLQDQGRSSQATPAMQSGYSKQLDKMPSRDALSGIGDVLRPAMQAIFQDVLDVRGFGDVVVDVRGFDFSDKATTDDMTFMEKSTVIDIQSDTYRRERDKQFVRLVLPHANPEVLQAIDAEIAASPTPEEAALQQQERQREAAAEKFSASLKARVEA